MKRRRLLALLGVTAFSTPAAAESRIWGNKHDSGGSDKGTCYYSRDLTACQDYLGQSVTRDLSDMCNNQKTIDISIGSTGCMVYASAAAFDPIPGNAAALGVLCGTTTLACLLSKKISNELDVDEPGEITMHEVDREFDDVEKGAVVIEV